MNCSNPKAALTLPRRREGGGILRNVVGSENSSRSMKSFKPGSRLSDDRGFSLAEILMAVTVFAIGAAIAVPRFIAFQPTNRLNGAARQIYSELMWARSKAVNENSSYVVTFPTNQTMLISGATSKTVNIQTEYSDVTLSSSAATITFSSRGTTDVGPTITLTNSGGTKTVTVRITGTVNIS